MSLGVVGLASQDAQVVRGVYLAMEPAGWSVLVPLSLASLSTGLAQARSTKWGLFRHCWVLMKFAINLVATVVLLMYMQTLDYLADIAAARTTLSELRNPSPVVHAGIGLVLLLVAATLSVHKPRGMTRYGQRKERARRAARGAAAVDVRCCAQCA